MNIKILVAMHKVGWAANDECYLPILCGEAAGTGGFTGDNTGDNISNKNKTFCELTALYWAWKNLDCDYIGLCHYRRYFVSNMMFFRNFHIYNQNDFARCMKKCDILLPNAITLSEGNVYNNYKYRHNIRDLDMTRDIMIDLYPEYEPSFDKIMQSDTMYPLNMFCMKKSYFNEYADWLFSILFELEKRIDIADYDTYQKRVFGFLAERLLNVWVHHNKLSIKNAAVTQIKDDTFRHRLKTFCWEKLY